MTATDERSAPQAPRPRSILEEPLLMRVEEASRYLSLGRTKTYELLAQGEIPSIRLGRSLRVPREALRSWIQAQIRMSGGGPSPREASELDAPVPLLDPV